jgi:hypothetical protein
MKRAVIDNLEKYACKHGLKSKLDIIISKMWMQMLYLPRTKQIVIGKIPSILKAFGLAHEIKHQIDLENIPPLLVTICYWPIMVIGGLVGFIKYGWIGAIMGLLLAKVFHPYEINANLYAIYYLRDYQKILRGKE